MKTITAAILATTIAGTAHAQEWKLISVLPEVGIPVHIATFNSGDDGRNNYFCALAARMFMTDAVSGNEHVAWFCVPAGEPETKNATPPTVEEYFH